MMNGPVLHRADRHGSAGIAAYIADPASGTPSPKAALAASSLAYGDLRLAGQSRRILPRQPALPASAVGGRAGDLLLTSNATNSPHHVTLGGTGVAGRTSGTDGSTSARGGDGDDDECEGDDNRTRCSALIAPIGKRRHREG